MTQDESERQISGPKSIRYLSSVIRIFSVHFAFRGLRLSRMSDAYTQLLDATIQHLQGLKDRGVRFVAVSPENLANLAQAPKPTASRPAPTSSPVKSPVSQAPVAPAENISEAKAAAFAGL